MITRFKLENIFKWIIALTVSFIILFPLYWIFISSITPAGELFQRPIKYIPENPTLSNYIYLIKNTGLYDKIISTFIIITTTLLISTIICVMAAYSFARYDSIGLKIAFLFILFSMLIPNVVTARPLYDFMRKVGLYDTYTGLIILYISRVIPFTVLILRNFVSNIPITIEEAAAIDGADFSQTIFHIILPLMKPAIATVSITNFIMCLNEFFIPLFYANNIQVLSTAITQLPLQDNMYSVPWDLVSSMGWIIILPIIIFVSVFEKQIMEGIMAGGVKA
ncbi:multiple sugar transport system permease protein [Halanaerobium saccharolyticum]|uniref:Multiple sugar transport system permease protein n=1 Tax=Halanaerobium saccharolyticum TaxID=43595 RepID=A0A4R7YSN7_9FIRM|nr:carbohydrate ABC transporter permease [Halanaerobium saccharolyticum]RAK06313.1 multiple sugar transport system permease protein [Halanaerobium saccharolyticum]TDW00792.1 multiple sugar transport system permease protein [Halanaerobium saccharolyticum]TDX52434.1 multiple sugar transport system permease protein [Halanaerobium saccharolyticum]